MPSSWEVEAFFVQLQQREGICEREQKRGIMVASLPPQKEERKHGKCIVFQFPPIAELAFPMHPPLFPGKTKLLLVRNLVRPKPATNRLPQPRKNFCASLCVSVSVSSSASSLQMCVCMCKRPLFLSSPCGPMGALSASAPPPPPLVPV